MRLIGIVAYGRSSGHRLPWRLDQGRALQGTTAMPGPHANCKYRPAQLIERFTLEAPWLALDLADILAPSAMKGTNSDLASISAVTIAKGSFTLSC